ncbi:hypothetical protein [Flavobacterium sp.]
MNYLYSIVTYGIKETRLNIKSPENSSTEEDNNSLQKVIFKID